ncbi:MAG: hypothetical protein AAFP77_19635 [Bacteroidota bacterium]
MSDTRDIETGWVVASNEGTFILPYTFKRTRTASIKEFMSFWDKSRCNWRKFKRQGYKCIKAQRTVEVKQSTPDEVQEAMNAFENLIESYPPGDHGTDHIMGDLLETGMVLTNYINSITK